MDLAPLVQVFRCNHLELLPVLNGHRVRRIKATAGSAGRTPGGTSEDRISMTHSVDLVILISQYLARIIATLYSAQSRA